MKTLRPIAWAAGLIVLLSSQQSSALPCASSSIPAPTVVEDTAGALRLAQAVNCSDGMFAVSWVGSVTVEDTIRVLDGTSLSVVGMVDGTSVVNGGGGVSLFHVSGGALLLSDLSLTNGAGAAGGAVYATDSVLVAERCSFRGNNATETVGGALYLESSELSVTASVFTGNDASRQGGAIYAAGSVLSPVSGTFSNNHAGDDGGAVFLDSSTLRVSASTFSGNSASGTAAGVTFGEGGAIYSADSVLASEDSTFSANSAKSWGGAMYVGRSYSSWTNCTFSANTAQNGGAIYTWSAVTAIEGTTTLFAHNQAEAVGGAVFCSGEESTLSVVGQALFANNSAVEGGGIYLEAGSSLSLVGDEVTMSGNNASSAGGGVFGTASTLFRVENTRFLSNSAGTTGGAMSLLSVGTDDSRIGAPATVSRCWFDGNEAEDAGGAVFFAGGFVEITDCDFLGNSAGRAGGAVLASGAAEVYGGVFTGNSAALGPAISNTVSVALEGVEFEDNTLACNGDGFFLDWNNVSAYAVACDACPAQCNNCTTVSPDRALQCEAALDHTTSPFVDGTLETLVLAPGYWRSSRTSTDVRECYEVESCVGGTVQYCGTGYVGPFCAVCAEGYTPGLRYTCAECTGNRRNMAIGVAVVLLLAASVAVAISVRYLGSSAEDERGVKIAQSSFHQTRFSQGIKIVIVSWQIVSQFSSVVSVSYPDAYEAFVGYIDVVDLDLRWMLSVECWVQADFFDTLLLTTIGPLVVSGLAVASFVIRRGRCRAEDRERRSRIKHRHATFLYLVSFLAYSTASSTIFQTFACDGLDTGESFLRADHSIQCYTTRHRVYMAFAGLMCLVYPFGIPFCYAVVLYRARGGLKSAQETVRKNATVLRALWAPYRKDVYYYEVVECLRRVTLSGLVVFILPNTAGQAMTAFLLSLFFFAVFTVLDPYENARDTWLARVGHAVVMMSMFVALVVKVDTDGDDGFSQDVFAGALVFVNSAMILAVVVEALGMCTTVAREVRGPVAASRSSGRGVENFGAERSPVW